ASSYRRPSSSASAARRRSSCGSTPSTSTAGTCQVRLMAWLSSPRMVTLPVASATASSVGTPATSAATAPSPASRAQPAGDAAATASAIQARRNADDIDGIGTRLSHRGQGGDARHGAAHCQRAPGAGTLRAMSSSPVIWVAEPAVLHSRLAAAAPRVGLDTEFIRERTYWPQLSLVQVALEVGASAPATILLLDMLAPGMPEALVGLLRDRAATRVRRSASQALAALGHACGALPEPRFDTQMGAGRAGVGAGLGYQRLVQALLGIAVDKGESRSHWMKRPLSPA